MPPSIEQMKQALDSIGYNRPGTPITDLYNEAVSSGRLQAVGPEADAMRSQLQAIGYNQPGVPIAVQYANAIKSERIVTPESQFQKEILTKDLLEAGIIKKNNNYSFQELLDLAKQYNQNQVAAYQQSLVGGYSKEIPVSGYSTEQKLYSTAQVTPEQKAQAFVGFEGEKPIIDYSKTSGGYSSILGYENYFIEQKAKEQTPQEIAQEQLAKTPFEFAVQEFVAGKKQGQEFFAGLGLVSKNQLAANNQFSILYGGIAGLFGFVEQSAAIESYPIIKGVIKMTGQSGVTLPLTGQIVSTEEYAVRFGKAFALASSLFPFEKLAPVAKMSEFFVESTTELVGTESFFGTAKIQQKITFLGREIGTREQLIGYFGKSSQIELESVTAINEFIPVVNAFAVEKYGTPFSKYYDVFTELKFFPGKITESPLSSSRSLVMPSSESLTAENIVLKNRNDLFFISQQEPIIQNSRIVLGEQRITFPINENVTGMAAKGNFTSFNFYDFRFEDVGKFKQIGLSAEPFVNQEPIQVFATETSSLKGISKDISYRNIEPFQQSVAKNEILGLPEPKQVYKPGPANKGYYTQKLLAEKLAVNKGLIKVFEETSIKVSPMDNFGTVINYGRGGSQTVFFTRQNARGNKVYYEEEQFSFPGQMQSANLKNITLENNVGFSQRQDFFQRSFIDIKQFEFSNLKQGAFSITNLVLLFEQKRGQKQSQDILTNVGFSLLNEKKQEQKKSQDILTNVGFSLLNQQGQEQKQRQEQRSLASYSFGQISLTEQKIEQKIIQPIEKFRPIKPKKDFEFRINPKNKRQEEISILPSFKKSFNVITGRGTKQRIIATNVPLGIGLAIGQERVKQTARASFKLVQVGITGKRDIPFNLDFGQFRPSKKGTGFVELSKYRINTPGEKREIPYRALQLKRLGFQSNKKRRQ